MGHYLHVLEHKSMQLLVEMIMGSDMYNFG